MIKVEVSELTVKILNYKANEDSSIE